MPKTVITPVRPKIGRGLNPRIGGTDSGELWDSFIEYRNVLAQEGAWMVRRNDFTANVSITGPIRSTHFYNVITDAVGTVSTKGVIVANDKLYDEYLNLIETLSDPYDLHYTNAKNRLFYGGANNEPRVWDGTTLASWGAVGPIGIMTYTAFTADSVNTGIQVQTVGVTNLSTTVTRVSGTNFVTGSSWVGKTIMIKGVEYTIASVTNANTLVLAIAYTGANDAAAPAQVHYGSRTWVRAPRYAYAYYNPTTGHCTNRSPVLVLADTAMTNVNVELGAIATNSTLYGYGYTKIVIFRSGTDGTDLLPLKLPVGTGDSNGFFNNTGGPLGYVDNTDDSVLGQILGYKVAPTENNPCPQHRYQAYYRGRFWVVDQSMPWRIRYSADPSLALGVPEESWPEENFLDINCEDGYALGLKVVGGGLICTTTRYAFTLTGTSPGDFDWARISTRGFGVAQRGIAEHPGDSSEGSASAIYVGRDRRLWRHFEGGRIEDIGAPIQQFLDNVRSLGEFPAPYLCEVFLVDRYWMLAVGISTPELGDPTPGYNVYFYDFDSQMWQDWGFGYGQGAAKIVSAMAPYTQPNYGTPLDGTGRLALYTNTIAPMVKGLLSGSTDLTGYFKTRYIDHGDWTKKKKLNTIRLYTTDATRAEWAVNVSRDGLAAQLVLERTSTSESPRIKGGEILEFVPKEVYHYHSLSVGVTIPGDTNRLFKFEIDCTPETTDEVGSPS